MSVVAEIGHGVTLRFFTDYDGEGRIGAIVEHPAPGYGKGLELGASAPDRCAGVIKWAGKGARWKLIRARSLTITPSVQCKVHPQFHGYITDGRWCPC